MFKSNKRLGTNHFWPTMISLIISSLDRTAIHQRYAYSHLITVGYGQLILIGFNVLLSDTDKFASHLSGFPS